MHTVETCQSCQCSLHGVVEERREKRQVFDVPALHIEVTEHQRVVKVRPQYGTVNVAKFPSDVS